jgi:phosphoribosylformylglycinamidine synthase
VYTQYDHELGIRTVIKPGQDSSVLRLDNGKFLSIKIDGNSKHCHVNPKQGVMGCFDEACRNIVCTGATPIGMVDHLQFGNPEDPEIFWTFKESIEGITEYAKYFKIPCVGGKVSLYNETDNGPIKPTPLIGVLGLIEHKPLISQKAKRNDLLVMVGITKDELGGSEYYEYIHDIVGGICPIVDLQCSKSNQDAVLEVIRQDLAKFVHDCSKGGLGAAVSEICITSGLGCIVSLDKVPSEDDMREDELLFSESHSRFLITVDPSKLETIRAVLEKHKTKHEVIGKFSGKNIVFKNKTKSIASVRVDKAQEKWLNSLGSLISHG